MEVRAKKALGQHFLTDLSIAQRIADALIVPCPGVATVNDAANPMPALEVGPGMGVLTQYVLQRPEVDLRMVEIDTESVDYLLVHFPQVNGKLIEADFLKQFMNLRQLSRTEPYTRCHILNMEKFFIIELEKSVRHKVKPRDGFHRRHCLGVERMDKRSDVKCHGT